MNMKHHIIQILASLIAASLVTTALAATVTDDFSSYPVGKIPYAADVTPIGARTYTVPIATTPFGSFLPSLSLQYSSQSGPGIAGHGWTVGGLSAITQINKNMYYHGSVSAASLMDSNPAYALDGVPIVSSSVSALSDAYPYETARGHILVRSHEIDGKVIWFDVLYPNGSKAVYGFPSNATNRISYPLTKITDINGMVIDFFYDRQEPTGMYYPSTIFYNYDEQGAPAGRIYFDYENVDSGTISYYAGQKIQRRKLLKAIRSNSGNDNLYTYTLTHESRLGANLLTSIGCRVGEASLRPLRFRYPEQPADSSDFYVTNTRSVNVVPTGDRKYLRGRFRSGATSDGVIILPDHSTYKVIASSTDTGDKSKDYVYVYGSGYAEIDKMTIVPELSSDAPEIILKAGAGFQAVEALDVDSDGVDEIVKVHFNGTEGDFTKLWIGVYKLKKSSADLSLKSFSVKVRGIVKDKGDNSSWFSPQQRVYLFGKFDGVGVQLVTVSLNRDFRGNKQVSQTAIIDLNTGECRNLVAFDLVTPSQIFSCDIDNDGKTELCYVEEAGGISVYKLHSGNLIKEKTIRGLNYGALIDRPYYCADWNGDGYLDIVVPPGETYLNPNYGGGSSGSGSSGSVGGIVDGGSEWKIYSYTGANFERTTLNLGQRSPGDGYMFIDVNRDGLSDMLCFRGRNLRCHLNVNGNSFSNDAIFSTATMPSSKGVIYNNILGYNAISGLITVDGHTITSYKFSDNRDVNRLVAEMEDSYGVLQTNEYANLMDSASVYGNDEIRSYSSEDGFARVAFPMNLLQKTATYGNSDKSGYKVTDMEYCYYDAVSGSGGLGFRGFGKVCCDDNIAGVVSVQEYDPEMEGVLIRSSKALLSTPDTPFVTVENTYERIGGNYLCLSPVLTWSVHTDCLTGAKTEVSNSYDSYDFLSRTITYQQSGEDSDIIWTGTDNVYRHILTPEKYLLGLLVDSRTRKKGYESAPRDFWLEKCRMDYDEFGQMLSKKVYRGRVVTRLNAPVGRPGYWDYSKLVSKTKWSYDAFGNVTSESVAPYGSSEYVGKSYAYTSDGHRLISETDALGRKTEYLSYNKFCRPERIVNHHGDTTKIEYDGFGNVASVERPDGVVETVSRNWGTDCLYTETVSSSVMPTKVTWYECLGRKMHTETQRFDGQWQKRDYVYDSQGRISKSSFPYREKSPYQWESYTYDKYGRLISETFPGHSLHRDYMANQVKEIRDDVERIITYDAAGKVVRVKDSGTSMLYKYRNDGQLDSVTCGLIVTRFIYDEYGRRTGINDPSAGIQTDSTMWNADGSSVRVQTNSNGRIISRFDKFGRVTKEERLGEFSTDYTYDEFSRLVSEVSTNGTRKDYTYDSYDRVLTEKEIVPDGKWLRKTFSYHREGMLDSVAYEAQSGYITTERYGYENGHNISLTILPDRMPVFGLIEENDYGQPVKVQTGDVLRTYGWSEAGLPTSRRMNGGSSDTNSCLMDFFYDFDPWNSRLGIRVDLVRNIDEPFGYDQLNRLRRMNGRNVEIDGYGNVCSIDGVGELYYKNDRKPYQVTLFVPENDTLVPNREQTVSYTAFGRPSRLAEGGKSASFTYNGSGDRVKMLYAEGVSPELTRYYIGSRYEQDIKSDGTTIERFYLGGDAYSAPMVLVREGIGNWTALNIGRDYLGSITHVATNDGTLLAEYSYDPWGRLRDPETQEIYAHGNEPELCLGRGFTGHEHLPWFGLINMNARLYDPLLCRFLSPDPYVQAPDFSQSFNRYSYALNNPLSYTDQSGESVWIIVGATVLGGVLNVAFNWDKVDGFWQGFTTFAAGAAGGALVAGTAFAGGSMAAIAFAGMGSGALTAFNNSIVAQTGYNFSGMDNVDWRGVTISTVAGAMTGLATSALASCFASSSVLSNLKSPLLKTTLTSPLISGAGHIVSCTAFNLMNGQSLGDALSNSFDEGLLRSMLLGWTTGLLTTSVTSLAWGIDPVTGKPLSLNSDGNYTVYVGRDPSDKSVKYVGITKRPPEVRWREHANSGTLRANLKFDRYQVHLNPMSAHILEQQLINYYGIDNLYNNINSIDPQYWDGYHFKW